MITDIVSDGCSLVWGQELENRDNRFVKIIANSFNTNLHDSSCPGKCNQLIATDIVDNVLDLIHNKKIPAENILVIVNWTFFKRLPYYNSNADSIESIKFLDKNIFNRFKNNTNISWITSSYPPLDSKKYDTIKDYYYDHDHLNYLKYHFFNLLYYVQLFLIANKIKYVFAFAEDGTVNAFLNLKEDKIFKKENNKKVKSSKRTSIENILKIIDTNYFYLNLNISQYTKMGFNIAPEGHPLADGHMFFAEELIAFIEEKYFEIGIVNDN